MKFILGKKIGMSQIFDEKGNQIPVTLIEAGPCHITQIKTKSSKDGYDAIQLGFLPLKPKKIKKTEKGKEFRYLREFRIVKEDKSSFPPSSAKADSVIVKEDKSSFPPSSAKADSVIVVSIFKEGDKVAVSGISKGKGFAGVVKRWGFHGRPRTRGTKHEERQGGSIGAATPSRVIKGIKMAGRMGSERITVKNLRVVKVDLENNLLAVRGAIPGRPGTLLEIRG